MGSKKFPQDTKSDPRRTSKGRTGQTESSTADPGFTSGQEVKNQRYSQVNSNYF